MSDSSVLGAAASALNGRSYFWTEPSSESDGGTNDPLGLDLLRAHVADRLVPCLTSRVWRHEDFYWTLVLIRWSESAGAEKKRAERFLLLERLLKLHWSHSGRRDSFAGVQRAAAQSVESGEPAERYRPLLKNARAQGLLGVHLGPLRALKLASGEGLEVRPGARKWISGAGEDLPRFRSGNWPSLEASFTRAVDAYADGRRFRSVLKTHVCEAMPQLTLALATAKWSRAQSWGRVASKMGAAKPFARFAGEFCGWADEVRAWFDEGLRLGKPPTSPLPEALRVDLPNQGEVFHPLKRALAKWTRSGSEAMRNLATMHADVFDKRGYGAGDLWVVIDESKLVFRPGLAAERPSREGADCRWSNAVALMRPRT